MQEFGKKQKKSYSGKEKMEDKNLKEDERSFDSGIKKLAGVGRLSPLRRYLFTIGKSPDPRHISNKELVKIENSSRYKQWKILNKLKRLADKIKQRKDIQEASIAAPRKTKVQKTKLDLGDTGHGRVRHLTHLAKLKQIKGEIISSMNQGIGDIVRDPASITTKNVKAQHAFKAIGKGKVLVRKRIGHRPQHTYTFREDIQLMSKEETPPEEKKVISDKTQKVLDKSKEIKLKTGIIEINPELRTTKTNLDRKD
jgi:hypothetical protein